VFQVLVMRLPRQQQVDQAMHQGRGEAMTTREEAAAKAQYEAVTGKPWEEASALSAKLCREDSAGIAAALDAHDLANNVHRVRLDDATVERAAEAMWNQEQPVKSGDRPTWDEILNDPGWEGGVVRTREVAKVALAAAVEATS
jgi:hypothetical protein